MVVVKFAGMDQVTLEMPWKKGEGHPSQLFGDEQRAES